MSPRPTPTRIVAVALLTAAAAAALAPTSARAAGATVHNGGGQRLKAALAELNLSADQKAQVRQILADAKRQPTPNNKAAARAVRRAVFQKVLAVLTPAQRAKLKQTLEAGRSTGAAKA